MLQSQMKLGELIIKEGLISKEQLDKALKLQKQSRKRLGETLVELNLITEKDIVITLSKQLGIPYASYAKGLLKPVREQELDKLIPHETARRYQVLPISRSLNSITVAFVDPMDLIVIDNLRRITGCEINLIIATQSDITKAIDDFYGKEDMLSEAISESYEENITEIAETSAEERMSLDTLLAQAEETPVVKLADLIIRQAIKDRASDIHIEPLKDKISLRYRVDGILYEIPPPAKHMRLPLISRIKILSRLDIAEKRLPQDGAFVVKINEKTIDIRTSTIPTIYGEKVVLRILDKTAVPLDIRRLGFDKRNLEVFDRAIHQPYGLIFITGPTGSGKTTTLYAALNEIKTAQKNFVTIEDPVEYRLDGISQVQIKPQIGLTFASGLRAFLRQDPDVIMVGEVRDLETAQICVRAALTGHLVFSTLHTNDAPTAVTRLLDIGIESYLLTPSLLVVVAQRLLRKLCPKCKEGYEPTLESIEGIELQSELIYKAKGCDMCHQTGYSGRAAIYEIIEIDKDIREMLARSASTDEIKETAVSKGMTTLWKSGLKKVEEGITSIEEVFRVVFETERE